MLQCAMGLHVFILEKYFLSFFENDVFIGLYCKLN